MITNQILNLWYERLQVYSESYETALQTFDLNEKQN